MNKGQIYMFGFVQSDKYGLWIWALAGYPGPTLWIWIWVSATKFYLSLDDISLCSNHKPIRDPLALPPVRRLGGAGLNPYGH